MNEIICPKCGKANSADADVCETCQTPLPKDTSDSAPDWLQKIREKSQSEKSQKPPLGEFGDAEERPFSEDVTPGEIPDWLKELQKLEPPKPRESSEPADDWMSRLHNILPESDRQALRSTPEYTQDELLAMAAAARRLEPVDLEPPEKANTQPLDGLSEDEPDEGLTGETVKPVESSASENLIHPFREPDIFDTAVETNTDLLSEPDVTPELIAEDASKPGSIQQEDISEQESAYSSPADKVSSDETAVYTEKSQSANNGIHHTGEPELYLPPDEPEPAKEEMNSGPFASILGGEEKPDQTEPDVVKPEKLIPEGVLQPQYNRSFEYSGRLELSDLQKSSINILKNMLVGEIQPQTPPEHGKVSGRILRLIIGLLLLIVMIIPLVTGFTITGQQALFSPGVVAMRKSVLDLPDGAPILVITDFEPAFSSELKAASTGVIDSLMMKRVNLSILSTIPAGPALAHDLIASVRSGPMAYQPEKIAYLGYLPGGTTGLRDFIRAPRQAVPLMENSQYAWTYPAAQMINSIQDYAGILVITENTEIGRAWIEQLYSTAPDTSLLMVVSAQSAPLMRPYLDSDQLDGLIGGRVEGAMYDRIMEYPPRSTEVMAAYQAGMLLAAALLLLGGLYGLLRGVFNRHSASSSEDWHVS